jgi:hypothetical protein
VIGGWIRHVRGVVGSAIAGFGGEKGAFDVPAGDGGGEFGQSLAQGAELLEAMDQPGPVVGDERGEEAAATSLVEGASGVEERRGFEVVLLEVDAGEAIDLEIDERWGEPGQVGAEVGGRGGDG